MNKHIERNDNDLEQHVTITNNKLSEIDVDEEDYETGDEEEDEGYNLPYKLKNINLNRSDSIENNHFVEEDDQINNIHQHCNNNQHYNIANNKKGNFYEYNFEGDELVEGDAGTTCLYNQVTSASYRQDSHQQQTIPRQQIHLNQSTSSPSSNTSTNKKRMSQKKTVITTSSLHVTTSPPTKLGSIRSWSSDTFEYAKQFVFERLGKTQKTSDSELEMKISGLKEIQKEFKVLHDISRLLYQQHYNTINTQKQLSGVLLDLSHKASDEDLCHQFNYTSISQKTIYKNGLMLLRHMATFVKSLDTLCNITIEDSLSTAKTLETARLKYDAYRSCLERVRNSHRDSHYTLRVQEAERNFNQHQSKYQRLHHDLIIKLKFLKDNRIKVFRKHLFLFQRGFHENCMHNKDSLDIIMQQFTINPTTPPNNHHHFLENYPQNGGHDDDGGHGGGHDDDGGHGGGHDDDGGHGGGGQNGIGGNSEPKTNSKGTNSKIGQ